MYRLLCMRHKLADLDGCQQSHAMQDGEGGGPGHGKSRRKSKKGSRKASRKAKGSGPPAFSGGGAAFTKASALLSK